MAGRSGFIFSGAIPGFAIYDVSRMDIKNKAMKAKAKEDKLKYHREYMNAYRQQHKERVKAQKNLNRGVMPGVFIMECF